MTTARLPTGKLPPALLAELLALAPPPPPELVLPPRVGEDAGVLSVPGGALVVATDPITLTGADVGAHAVVINANDVAVMGARPRWFLAVVLLPPATGPDDVRALFRSMHAALDEAGIALVGGHTEITAAVVQPVVVGQMIGLREDGAFVRTGGMRPGDRVVQVGPAPVEGAAVLAAEAGDRLGGIAPDVLAAARAAIRDPGISVVDAAMRATDLGATAMHDPTEGGLATGLRELADASGTGLEVDPSAVLWFDPGRAVCDALGVDPWGVLGSGTLLAAFPADRAAQAVSALRDEGHRAAVIAAATDGGGIRFRDGADLPTFERDEVARILG
jgi:hydrogenase expression/formation protein HypE